MLDLGLSMVRDQKAWRSGGALYRRVAIEGRSVEVLCLTDHPSPISSRHASPLTRSEARCPR